MHHSNSQVKTLRLNFPEFVPEILNGVASGLGIHYIIKGINQVKIKKKKEIKPEFDIEKNYMLSNICRLYETPDFDMENPTMDKTLIHTLYDVSIELLLKHTIVPNHRMAYIAKNYSQYTSDKLTLISALEKERDNPNRHDSRFRMGFRSVYVLISDNIDKIDKNELKDILKKLKPFFNNYSHKESLNHYVR